MKQIPSLPRLLSGALVFSALSLGAFVLAPSAHAATVTVRPGDTLSKLFPSSWAHVCRINGLANCNLIYVGQQLNDGNSGSAAPAPQVRATTGRTVPTWLVVGKPYVYGANGPYAYDCSSMTQFLAAQMGFSIPRTSQAQWGAGRPISRGELCPGDLIIMNSGGHVGMYLGNGQMIQALNPSQGILVSSIEYGTALNTVVGYRAIGH